MKRLLFAVLGLGTAPLAGQASLVPVDHPVYEWLHRQRVRGHAPRFAYEALPITRGAVAGLLDSLAARGGLPWIERRLLASFRAEFQADSAQPLVTLTQGREASFGGTVVQKARLILSDRTPHLFRARDEHADVTVDYLMGTGWFTGSEVTGSADRFEVKHLRVYGTLYDRVGFHLDALNASGSDLFPFHPQWGKTYETLVGEGATVWAQGFVSAGAGPFGFDIGTGTQRVGTPGREAVILRPFSANFDWVRLRFATRVLQYSFTHGALAASTHDTLVPGTTILTRLAPARWVALRRIQLTPGSRLQLGFTEALTYSNRGVELAYLNPVYPLRIAEFNTNGRDNPVWYLDAVVRPLDGVELSGTLGIDDMASYADWLRPTGGRSRGDSTTKLLYQAWGTVALPTATDLFGGFVRVEPFFYTHRFPLNTFEQWGSALGTDVGPNADEWTIGVRQWLPWRGSVALSLSGGRHGLDVVDSAGNVVEDVGGALTSVHTSQRILFLAGDVHHTRTWRVEAALEPVRGFRLDLAWQRREVTRGTRLPEFDVLRIGAELMFYPVDLLLLPF